MTRLPRILLSLGLAVGLLALLFAWGGVTPRDLWDVWRRLPLGVWLAALAVHAGIYVLRAVRFRLLIPPEGRPGFASVLTVSAAHNLAAYVLPAKTGEASLVLYLKRLAGVPAAEGFASLLVSRLLDLAVLAGGMALACLGLGALDDAGTRPWALPLGGALAAGAALLGLVTVRGPWLVGGVAVALRGLRLERYLLGRRFEELARRVAEALERAGSEGRLARALALSVPLWLGVFLFYAVLAQGLGLLPELDLLRATFGSGLAVLFNLLPVNGFAGFGTQEAGWVIGFGALGVPRAEALSSGLGVHLVQLLDVVLFGLAGHVGMGLLAARRPAASAAGAAPGSTGADAPGASSEVGAPGEVGAAGEIGAPGEMGATGPGGASSPSGGPTRGE